MQSMSRFETMLERLIAQRNCIDYAVGAVGSIEGPVLEFGLGKGRTYDHLRKRLPDRQIFVFERSANAQSASVRDSDHLVTGDIRELLPRLAHRFAKRVVLIHADIGTGNYGDNAALARVLADWIPELIKPGGIVIANRREMRFRGSRPLALPPDTAPGHCYMFTANG